jgi:putative salt-induced outer membrane protein YdiY
MRCKIFTIMIVLLLCAALASADEVTMTNGDHLKGKIVNLVDGKLLFKSDLAGETKIDLAKIQTMSSDELVTVGLKDNTVFTQKLSSSTAGRFSTVGTNTLPAQNFAVADIVSINKPAPNWTGNISANLTATRGNTIKDSYALSAKASKRTDDDRTTLSADYAKTKQEFVDPVTGDKAKITTEDWWKLKAKYDYFFSKKLYGYVDGRYEKDAIAELDRRVTVGVGVGYQWVEKPDLKFSTEAGLASKYEKFDDVDNTTNSDIAAQLGYLLEMKLAKNLNFLHELTYYPAIDKFSDYYLTTSAELRYNVSASIFLNAKVMLDYDKTPAIGKGSTDTKYFLGLGYNF